MRTVRGAFSVGAELARKDDRSGWVRTRGVADLRLNAPSQCEVCIDHKSHGA